VGALGSVIVIWSGGRFGRAVPLGIALAATLMGTALFLRSDIAGFYVAGNVITAIAWSFVVPYLFGMCSQFDRAGQAATLGGFFSKMGLATGPAAAALLLGEGDDFSRLILAALIALAACTIAALWPARRLDQHSTR
jgi:hypothetical protein